MFCGTVIGRSASSIGYADFVSFFGATATTPLLSSIPTACARSGFSSVPFISFGAGSSGVAGAVVVGVAVLEPEPEPEPESFAGATGVFFLSLSFGAAVAMAAIATAQTENT